MRNVRTCATNLHMRSDDELLTTAEVANRCRVSRMTVSRWVTDGKLHAIRLPGGRSLRFRAADVDAILEPTGPAEAAS